MVFELSKFNLLEHVWNTQAKTQDGNHILYSDFEVEQLWRIGIIDTRRVTLDEWKQACEPFRKDKGSFLFSHEEFLGLGDYCYKGEIKIPFDAMEINEGKYTDDGLDELVNISIAPSCSLDANQLNEFVDALKKDFRDSDGLIIILKPAKEQIKDLLDNFPSPLRNLEVLFDHVLRAMGVKVEEAPSNGDIQAAAAETAKEISKFSKAPTTRTEQLAKNLKNIEKARKKHTEVKGVEKVELKKIKRNVRGMRG